MECRSRIVALRHQRGLSQKALAQAIGISPSYLNLIEQGRRPVGEQLQQRFADILQVSVSTLRDDPSVDEINLLMESHARYSGIVPSPEEVTAFIICMPKWAHLIQSLVAELVEDGQQGAEQSVEGHLTRALFDSVAATTSIRSITEILLENAGLDVDRRRQFLGLIQAEALRLGESNKVIMEFVTPDPETLGAEV